MDEQSPVNLPFGGRLKLALRVLSDAAFAQRLVAAEARSQRPAPTPEPRPAPALPPERIHASGLSFLAALQREGRLVDFLQQDVVGFSDEDVAAAARVVHAGCRRVLQQSLDLEPAVRDAEGSNVTLASGFDAQRIRLTGNVAGQPPFHGTVRHHGWYARSVRLPEVSPALDPRVIAAADIELS